MHLTHTLGNRRIVSVIFAIWSLYSIVYVLLVLTGANLSPSFEWILYPFYLSLFPAWFGLALSIPIGWGFIIFFGMLAVALSYPLVSYYLWHGNRVAWGVALAMSLLTVVLDAYFLLVESIAPLLVSGIALNLFVACLLWRAPDFTLPKPPKKS